MYYMAEMYRSYCKWVLEQVQKGNALHQRIRAKLASKEVMAGLKARALMFICFHQPMRVCIKSTKFGGGRTPSQLDLHPVWNRLHSEASRLESDPTDMMNQDYFVFNNIQVCEQASSRYRSTTRNTPMIKRLFEVNNEIDEIVVNLLKAYCTAARLRMEKKVGGAAEFLEGGEFHILTPDVREKLSKIPGTSDTIESFFGVLDLVTREQSKNLSYHVSSGLATWRYMLCCTHTCTHTYKLVRLHTKVQQNGGLGTQSTRIPEEPTHA